MRVRLFVLLGYSLLVSVSLVSAQTQSQPAIIKVPDGGASGRMESIFIPPKAGAPFSLMLVTEWSRPMGNGGTFTLTNERRIVRDGAGRIYQERWILVPKGSAIKSHMDVFQITDPDRHTWYNCITETKVCDLYLYRLETTDSFLPAISTTGPLPDGNGSRLHEDLGSTSTAGLETHGYRETLTINPGVMGNDKPMVTTREFWYSPELAINVVSFVDSPQSGRQAFTIKDLSTSEPEASFFVVPDDYKIKDRRNEQ
jgi:hypothetical protein